MAEYSHRNGETTDPAVDGWYWVVSDTDAGVYFWEHKYGWYAPGARKLDTKIYGPIPLPHEALAQQTV